jgi:hypothetical protein
MSFVRGNRSCLIWTAGIMAACGLALWVLRSGIVPVSWRLWPISVPGSSERAVLSKRAATYLDAWSRQDGKAMHSLTSPSARFGENPTFPGGNVELSNVFWRPCEALAHVFASMFGRDDKWDQWRNGRVAFVVYELRGRKYFLMLVKDDEWLVLNGPGCELPRDPRRPNGSVEPLSTREMLSRRLGGVTAVPPRPRQGHSSTWVCS